MTTTSPRTQSTAVKVVSALQALIAAASQLTEMGINAVDALRDFGTTAAPLTSKPSTAAKPKAPAKPKGKGSGKRTVLDEVQKVKLIAMLKEGTTAAAAAEAFGVSAATVNNIKKEAGLTKARGAATPAKKKTATKPEGKAASKKTASKPKGKGASKKATSKGSEGATDDPLIG